jgi:hypothetical protein
LMIDIVTAVLGRSLYESSKLLHLFNLLNIISFTQL